MNLLYAALAGVTFALFDTAPRKKRAVLHRHDRCEFTCCFLGDEPPIEFYRRITAPTHTSNRLLCIAVCCAVRETC